MNYSVKYRLDYCNNNGENARLDIELKDYVGVIFPIEATGNPFELDLNSDEDDRSGYIKATTATIQVYEDENFNIDTLLTSDETALRVKFYIDSNLYWVGFVIPDFYEVSIKKTPVITMTASDRLGTLKEQSIEKGVGDVASFKDILTSALSLTGLNLPIVSTINFTLVGQSKTFLENTGAAWGRFIALEKNEEAIAAYDVIQSILITANAYLFQRNAQWIIINKLEHESNVPTKIIEKINVGGTRLISQSLQELGVFGEFGGGRIFPFNYDFSEGLTYWNLMGGIDAEINTNEVIGYTGDTPVYGASTETKSLKISEFLDTDLEEGVTPKFIESHPIPVFSLDNSNVDLSININMTGNSGTRFYYQIYYTLDDEVFLLGKNGEFFRSAYLNKFNYSDMIELQFMLGDADNRGEVITGGVALKAKIVDSESLNNAQMYIRLYNIDEGITTFVNFISIRFDSEIEQKGNLYKTKQVTGSTRKKDILTSIFSDYVKTGLNGYFYYYSPYEVSNIHAKPSIGFTPYNLKWVTPFDSTPLPLLTHSVRQVAKMFSAPHNIISATISGKLDPLDIFNVCENKYVIVSASYDFFRNTTELLIEEVKYAVTVKTDYLYSYFGGEDTDSIRGVSTVPSGGGSGGGGVQLGETEFEAYRGDRGKIAYDHSQNSTLHFDSSLTKTKVSNHLNASNLHFDTSSGAGKITRSEGANLVNNLGDGSGISNQVSTNTQNISTNTQKISTNTQKILTNTNNISNIATTLGDYAQTNGDITKAFSASQLTTNKIILNGIELTIEVL